MTFAASIVLALWSVLARAEVYNVAIEYEDLHGNERYGTAAGCFEGVLSLFMSPDQVDPMEALAHELAHGADCLDNGVMDGSWGPQAVREHALREGYCAIPGERVPCFADEHPRAMLRWLRGIP